MTAHMWGVEWHVDRADLMSDERVRWTSLSTALHGSYRLHVTRTEAETTARVVGEYTGASHCKITHREPVRAVLECLVMRGGSDCQLLAKTIAKACPRPFATDEEKALWATSNASATAWRLSSTPNASTAPSN